MKRFLPYFALLRDVKFKFAAGLVAGFVYALASGAGIPVMVNLTFPIIFGDSGKIVEVQERMEAEVGEERAREWISEAFPEEWEKQRRTREVRQWFDERFGEERAGRVLLITTVAMLPLMAVIRGVAGFLNVYWITVSGLHVLVELQGRAYRKLQQLPLAFFSGGRSGDILNRVMGDASILQSVITTVGNDLIRQPFTLIAVISFLAVDAARNSNSFFLLASLVSLPIIVMPIRVIGKRLMGRAAGMQEQASENLSILSETLGATREIRAFNLQDLMTRRFVDGIRQLNRLQLKVVRYRYVSPPMIEVVAASVVAAALAYGATREFELERFIAIVVALYMSYEPIKKLAGVHARLKVGEVSLNRIEKILKAEDSMPDPEHPVKLGKVKGSLRFEDVSFSYDGQPALKDVNIEIPAGQVVALVGPSGAGKTTFASLVPRFFDPNEGRVSLDGVDLRDVKVKDLRDQITLVPQDAILLAGSVADNIRLGRIDASDADVVQAARQANADEFIRSKDKGYDTQVGERGVQLSGGQKQRISIARAFLKDSPVLVLDEATASLDSESEAQIQHELGTLTQGRTTLIVAHRFSSIRIADRVLVFDRGRIVGDGTFDELAKSHELFQSLLKRQQG